MRDNVDSLDRLVKRALSGNILDDRPLELALLELAGVLLLPRVGLVLRTDGTANAGRNGRFSSGAAPNGCGNEVATHRKPFWRNWRVTSVPTKPVRIELPRRGASSVQW